ncbi:hypothetical protein ICE98_00192 [Lactococcus lactis]|nr:hypothetical protein [Lactococcus lactis]
MLGTMLQRDSTSMDVKCHALVSESGYVIDYTITPASMADSSMTEEVLSQFGQPTVLGDWDI